MSPSARNLVASALLAVLAAPGSTQLVNGGAEIGSPAPWVADLSGAATGNTAIIKAVTTQVQTAPPVFPAVGNRFFSFATQVAGPVDSFVRLSQTVTIVGAPSALALTGQI